MFNAIRGTLISRGLDWVHVDTHGIEWDIAVPATMVDALGNVGDQAIVLIFLQHREDSMKLFGFPDENARSRFIDLMKVDGIGAKQALRILSGILPDALSRAVESEDLSALERVPGIGKKTAQKIVLALKGKLVSSAETGSEPHADVVNALIEMGFDRKAAAKAVKDASAIHGSDERELFKTALLSLSGGIS
jgi:Holliday junction DNA helicase RuvA